MNPIDIATIRKKLGNSADIVFKEFNIQYDNRVQTVNLIYAEGFVDTNAVQDFVLETLMVDLPKLDTDKHPFLDFMTVGDVQELQSTDMMYHDLFSGHVILIREGTEILSIAMSGIKDRAVSEAMTETVSRGPKEAFTENIQTNTALIRRKIKNPNLWLENLRIGKMTQTNVSIMYINGIVTDKIVDEVRSRLARIDIDGILESGYIEELIQDAPYSPFPTVYNSERPDVIAAELLEGKIAILVDGTPHVLVVPALFISFMHSAEDYYQRADISSLIRILRFVGIFIALLGPSLYIAITTFHQEMLPTQLLIGLAAQREGIPFPAFIEALIMEITFEILREAGVRMPRTMGQAMSIVGTLVIGQSAVAAGIVSAAMVIVVSITAISSFVVPAMNMSISIRMIRFLLMGLAASFGLYGIILGIIVLVLHLCSLRTFGVPYMSPFGPYIAQDTKDTLIRLPHWAMRKRLRLINQNNLTRSKDKAPGPERR
ncbi:spore germination protein [Paenibacillus glycanilyticus]|uniref:Spore germination protein KA n=1 Tax=Paenibacillus glycanilyticus TaxID=126569 RepID=A0ABQ6GD23_9BACL|nr:spore germination protein [Paenibacillus glycanilyticus]GLX67476.1 spore germination protein KA [Paenibacillus glycanilyticus]